MPVLGVKHVSNLLLIGIAVAKIVPNLHTKASFAIDAVRKPSP